MEKNWKYEDEELLEKEFQAQVMEMTRPILGLEKIPKPDDAADALALAVCHAHAAGSILSSSRLKERLELL